MADTELVRIKVAEAEKRLVPADRVESAGVRIGVVTRQGLLRLENDLPPMLEGLSAPKMKKVLRGVMRNLLRDWSKFSDEAFEEAREGD